MYTNGINTYNKLSDEKPKLSSQSFDADGESFSDLMEKEEPAGKGLRETAQELAEDESILSTDEENLAMARRGKERQEQAPKPEIQQDIDKARLLRLMDMSNKINLTNINITKSKKELENTVGPAVEDNDEPEDITSIVAKMAALKEETEGVESDNVETEISSGKHAEDFEEERRDNSQILYETEEELQEDLSILSTDEENLEMARRNSAMNRLSDDNYKTTEDDMMFLNDIVALNNQMHVEKSDLISNTQNVLSALMSKTNENSNRLSVAELSERDVDCLIGLLSKGLSDSSHFTDENNDELHILSQKFLAMLQDSIKNRKVFRIDFDNNISVIIKISTDGKLKTEFLTNDDAVETYLKNNLHILKEKFEEIKVEHEEITCRNTNKES
ncbi:MAG: hypothetical protein K6E29_04300 [Cyanobacteria bacterium RUI128]|nr:hypothetical protein [Cyanobacteria bacterium RUI128]